MEQLFEMLKQMKADGEADKEEMETNRKKEKEKMEANRKKDKEDLMAKLDTYQAKMESGHKMLRAGLDADRQAERRERREIMKMVGTSHKEMAAETKPEEEETMACQEMEARLEEPTSVDMKPEAVE
ncbi:hypothetical protein B7P43_G04260 [Cryptotermes secundus]|uniref:Uncharacterized protein n=1 Tax=Cryptotermes secundus TaxID=105785 RepID=A0A2J7PW99_9NEOP|nr:hypothetical protein B7P43_G04260 [Cryptotermes secundus]